MPTPVNNNNTIYTRLYKTINALQAEQVITGDTDNNQLYSLSVKGSIDIPFIKDGTINACSFPVSLGEIIVKDLLIEDK